MSAGLIFLVTEDWYFCSHRLPQARAARQAGFEVMVATRASPDDPSFAARIRAEGYALAPLAWSRRSLNPFAALRALAAITALYRREKPRLVHHVALKPVLLGGLAARFAGVPRQIAAITGVGFVFASDRPLARWLRLVAAPLLRFALKREGVVVLFQHDEDRALFLERGLCRPDQARVIAGSGVDTERFLPLPEPAAGPVVCGFAGRMLRAKGVDLLVEAARQVRAMGVDLRLELAGQIDPGNPSSFTEGNLAVWRREDWIALPGQLADVRELWARAHIAVLPAREREGIPKTLLDAAACGRPIVASDVPGVRAVARAGENALLVPPGDTGALAAALARLAQDAMLRQSLGRAGRALAETLFATRRIEAETLALYREALKDAAGGSS